MRSFRTEHYDLDASLFAYGSELPEKIAVVSDFHNVLYEPGNEPLIDAVRKEAPELIVCPGDMMTGHGRTDNRNTASLLKSLGSLGVPVLCSFGNHETGIRKHHPEVFEAFRKEAAEYGVTFLDNEWFSFAEHIFIGGLTVPMEWYKRGLLVKKAKAAEISGLLPKTGEGLHILLAHNPAWFQAYEEYGSNITFAGHMHGGMIRLPLLGGVISPQYRLFPKYDAGEFHRGNSVMFVSRGLGSHTIPLRINNKPELMIIRVKH